MTLTYKEYLAMPRFFQDEWERMIGVIERMRTFGDSLRSASRAFGISEHTVLSLGGSALEWQPDGSYVAKPTDTLLRIFLIPSKRGDLRAVPVRDSREVNVILKYWSAFESFYSFDSATELRNLRRKYLIDENGTPIPLLTDLKALERYKRDCFKASARRRKAGR